MHVRRGGGRKVVDIAAIRRGDAASITNKAREYVAAVAAARAPRS
ncbi:MAG: hypothetical protein ACXV7D_01880 [Thermoanaerobaculia bacterium]